MTDTRAPQPATPDFLFDVGSPNAYLAHRVLPTIEARTGVRFAYVPVLLGGVFKTTGNQSPAAAYAAIPSKMAYEALEMRRFVERHGLAEFRFNPHFPLNTLAMMRGAVAAQSLGMLPTYLDAVFRGVWVDGLKMDDPAVLTATLAAARLPVERLLELSVEDEVKQALIASTDAAVARGVFGLPTFFVGDEMFFGKDRLDQVEQALIGAIKCYPNFSEAPSPTGVA